MFNDTLTRLAERRAHERVLSPYIIRAREGKLREAFQETKSFSPPDLLEKGRFLDRLPDGAPFRYRTIALERFNFVLTLLPRKGLFDLAQSRNIDKIFPDELQFAFQRFPTVPDKGVYTSERIGDQIFEFTTTDYTRRLMGADIANKKGYTGRGVHVTVPDTGASRSHEQIRRVEFETTQYGQYADGNGHGTWVCATIGGRRKLNERLTRQTGKEAWAEGFAPNSGLTAVKCLGYVIGTGLTSQILEAMHIAIENGSEVCSMSLGGPMDISKPEESPYYEPLKKMRELGIVPCVATGNSGPNRETLGVPGALPDSLSVAAYDPISGEVADFSSRGPTPWGTPGVDTIAPGVNIMSGTVGQLDMAGTKTKDRYTAISGTSMATPHVAGLVTLMKEAMRETTGQILTLDEIKSMLIELGSPQQSLVYGHGMMDWSMFEEWMSTEYGIEV